MKNMDSELSTLDRIHIAAKEEFLEKGFKSASLRNIVKTAGVTTGAFYGYYSSKEELFRSLVSEVYDTILGKFKKTLNLFEQMPLEKQVEEMGELSRGCLYEILEYSLLHIDELHLILQSSEGTPYNFLIDSMVDLEIDSTHKYYETLSKLGYCTPDVEKMIEHILVTGMMNAFFEIIIHELPLEEARICLSQLFDFYNAGWLKIMGQE